MNMNLTEETQQKLEAAIEQFQNGIEAFSDALRNDEIMLKGVEANFDFKSTPLNDGKGIRVIASMSIEVPNVKDFGA